ncbi:MAG TPA: hypothetical protein P5313_11150 [Spirochaetia bacterium]|nr:hypothetical protein [Spirochaetales bacterium]HRY80962.1 hypothetical protein [Spirochaetia bacterium]
MKKFLVLLLVLAALAPAFADDAKVLPKGVFRLSFVFARNAYDERYDANGDISSTGEVSALAIGTALEFGVTDQVTAAVQWTPAYAFNTSIESVAPLPFDPTLANADGLADLFVGAKFLIMGAQGFVPNDTFRIAFAPGVLIPLDNPDWAAEVAAAIGGNEYKVTSPSTQAIGLGFRTYFDWVLSKMFYINLYNQTIFYLPVTKSQFNPLDTTEHEYAYGYKLTFEAEPHFDYSFSDKVSVSVGVPVTFTMGPQLEIDGAPSATNPEYYILSASPSASVFVMAFMPFELKAGYTLPILGKNANAASTLVFQLKTFLKF